MSTRVEVDSGICGFKADVTARKTEGGKYEITIESDCEMIQKMAEELKELDRTDALTRFFDNPVYRRANACLKHVACPVPSGILKALEVEAGLCIPKNASIVFLKEG